MRPASFFLFFFISLKCSRVDSGHQMRLYAMEIGLSMAF